MRRLRPLFVVVATSLLLTACLTQVPTFPARSYMGGTLTALDETTWPGGSIPGPVMDVHWPDPWTAENPPPPGTEFPTVVLIPGGFQGDLVTEMHAPRRYLASGIAVVKLSFRNEGSSYVFPPEGRTWLTPAPWPQPANDVDTAMRFLRHNADILHVDPDMIVIQAEAGGAFLAAAVTTGGFKDPASPIPAEVSPVPNGLVLVNGVFHLTEELMADEVALTGRELFKRMIGCDPFVPVPTPECQAATAAAAPFHLANGSTPFPPTLMFHGEADVPPRSQVMAYKLCVGTPNPRVRLTLAPGIGHYFFPLGDWAYENATGTPQPFQEELDDFLVSLFGSATTLDGQTPDGPLADGTRTSCGSG